MRSSPVWIIFAACLAVAVAAMGWISATVLRLDRAAVEAQSHAAIEENVRLALWRMDSATASIIAQENARPYFEYNPAVSARVAYGNLFNAPVNGDAMVASPLLTQTSPFIRLHFQIAPGGVLSSPEVIDDTQRAQLGALAGPARPACAAALGTLRASVTSDQIAATLPAPTKADPFNQPSGAALALNGAAQSIPPSEMLGKQLLRSQQEYSVRNTSNMQVQQQAIGNNADNTYARTENVATGMMKPIWIGDNLLLVRRVAVKGEPYIQGVWLDWSATRQWLLASVSDLLPRAQLLPVLDATGVAETRQLASLPARIAPGDSPIVPAASSPVRATLWLAWAGTLLAALAVAGLLRGVMALSERRGAFVSAVTHELRTPITTLRMYAEMLAGGMVNDDAKRGEYLRTIHGEADRLGHLVENVLAYSRLERTDRAARLTSVGVGELLERVGPRLTERARQAGFTLTCKTPDARSEFVRADALAVEQILFNLVDNACKYAGSTAQKQIDLTTSRTGERITFRVRDYGPGLSDPHRRKLFRPFSKSVTEAANSAPGLGLGLALSRRLAREMNGDLELDASIAGGAAFVLSLPVASTSV